MATSASVLGEVERLSEGSAIKDCEELAKALGGDVGESVEKIQKLILHYYDDVRQQAAGSFNAARRVALAGFAVLTITVAYVVAADIGDDSSAPSTFVLSAHIATFSHTR